MKSKSQKFIDFEKVTSLLEGFFKVTGFGTAILDLEGNVLSTSGWRQICTEFHRINPETAKNCRISDTELTNKMAEGKNFHYYQCLNGLVDVVVPIVIKGEHIANLFSGQFFLEEPDRNFFKKQAKKYGFDEKKYLKALDKVPVFSEEKVQKAMDFLLNITQLISEMAYQKMEQTEMNKELEEIEFTFKKLFKESSDAILLLDENNVFAECNQAALSLLKISREQLLSLKPEDISPEYQPDGKSSKVAAIEMIELACKKGYHRFDWTHTDTEGEEFIVDISLIPVLVKGKRMLHTTWRNITEHKRGEETLRESEKHSAFLAHTAFELTELTSIQEIYKYAVHKLYELIEGNAIVALVEFHQSENRWKMQQIKGVGKKVAKLNKLLGFDINKMEGDISTKYYEQITSGKFVELDFDLPGLFNNKLMAATGNAVKRFLSIEKLYCISYRQDDQILGNINIITNNNTGPIKKSLIEAFVQQICNFVKKQIAEEKLKESEEKYRRIADNVTDVVWVTDLEMTPTYISPSVKRVFGITPDEYLKLPLGKTYPPASLEKFQKKLAEEFAKEKDPKTDKNRIFQLEVERYYADRTLGWDAISAHFIRDKQNNPIAIQGVSRDITKRKLAEEALRESETRFQKMLGVVPDMISIQNPEMDILYSNWQGFADVPENKQILNTKCHKTYRNFDEICPDCLAKSVLETRKPIHKETQLPNNTWYDIRVIPILDKDNNVEMFMEWVRDITERKQEELIRQLQYNIARATITTRNLKELFDSIQNELNNIIDAKNLFIALYNEETGMLYSPLFEDEKDDFREWPAGKTATSYVVRKGQTVLLNREDSLKLREKGLIEIVGTPAEAWLGVPLKVGGKMLGAVVVQNYDNPDVYDQTSIEIMEMVAHELSMYIDWRHSEEMANKLSRAVEQSSVSVVITNREGAIEYVNPFFTELTGYSFEEVKGNNPSIMQSGHQSNAFYKQLWDTILSGSDWNGEILNKKKNGELYWEQAVISPILNNDGVITNFVALKEDITKRKYAEKELQIKNTISNVFVMSAEENFYEQVLGIFREFFECEYGFFGYINEEGDLVTESMTRDVWVECQIKDKNIIFPKSKWGGLWGKALNKKKTLYQNGNLHFPDGHISLQNAIAAPLVINNKLIGQIALANKQGGFNENDKKSINNLCDYITPLLYSKLKEEKYIDDLLTAKEKAQESDRLKSAFLANMSHEIRTPMNGILGFADLLLKPDLSSEERDRFLKIVHQSGQRMLNTVNDIVEISKIEAGLINIIEKEIDINERVEELTRFFQLEAEEKGLNLILEKLLPEENRKVITDPNKLDSILTNLIKNAIKYTDTGTICVGCIYKGMDVEFYVKDTGIGIPKNRHKAVFNRFEQADIEDRRVFQGSGLGLAISKSYLEMLDGKIWLESEEGIGSTFYFTLPYNNKLVKEAAFHQTDISEKKGSIKKLKILLAEDDEVSEMLLKEELITDGKEILTVKTGVEAVETCKSNPDIDLVLMDIRMPEMNGYEAASQIREFNKEVVIIAQTAYGLMGDREKAMESGCDDYISKPIRKTKLQKLIQKYFGE